MKEQPNREKIKMNNLSNLTITNREFDLNTGFFWVEFENGKSLQCCLKDNYDYDIGKNNYQEQIELNNNGYSDGICADVNEWALGENFENSAEVHDFLIEQAREAGLQIIA